MFQDTKKLKEMATTICNKYVSGNAAIHGQWGCKTKGISWESGFLIKESVETNGKVEQIKFSQNAPRQQSFAEWDILAENRDDGNAQV